MLVEHKRSSLLPQRNKVLHSLTYIDIVLLQNASDSNLTALAFVPWAVP